VGSGGREASGQSTQAGVEVKGQKIYLGFVGVVKRGPRRW
jgi:hypothetical protein